MTIRTFSDGNPDGTTIGGAADKIGFFGQVPVGQRTNPIQATIGNYPMGQVLTFSTNQCPLANIAGITVANQANMVCEGFNVQGLVGANAATGDFIVGISKATAPGNAGTNYVGLTVSGWKASAANNVDIQFISPANANGNIVSNEVQWSVAVLRGFPVQVQNLVPASVPLNSTSEQVFTVGGSNATANATAANGQLTGVQVTAGGSGYYTPPTVVFTPAANTTGSGYPANQALAMTGTMLPYPIQANGYGASAIAVCTNGVVTSIVITDAGDGYTTAPTVSFISTSLITPGMFPVVQKNAFQAGLGIGNVRIVDRNQLAIQFVNPTAANILPTANEAYAFIGIAGTPSTNPLLTIRANLSAANASGVGSGTGSTNYVVPGIMASDVGILSYPAVLSTGANATAYISTPPVCGANAINDTYIGSNIASNKAAGTYYWTMMRQQMLAPIQVFQALVTPTVVATLASSEQTFTLPSNMTLSSSNNATNFNVLQASKPSYTAGISLGGCRAVSNTTFAITFINTSSGSIIPPAEVYTFAYFPTPAATISANIVASHTIQYASPALMLTFLLANELQQMSVMYGLTKGG